MNLKKGFSRRACCVLLAGAVTLVYAYLLLQTSGVSREMFNAVLFLLGVVLAVLWAGILLCRK